MAGKDGDKQEYTIKNVESDLKLLAKTLNAVGKRLEVVEAIASNVMTEEDSRGDSDSTDKQKSLSILANRVFNPSEDMLIQMTEIPNRMVMPIVIERTMNEYIKIITTEPNSDVLLSDLFMKHYSIVMRALRRQLISEAMGFSQIEMDKTMEEEERKAVLEE